MIAIEKCTKILRAHNLNLTNEEIKQVREQLYLFAAIQMEFENNNNNIIKETQDE